LNKPLDGCFNLHFCKLFLRVQYETLIRAASDALVQAPVPALNEIEVQVDLERFRKWGPQTHVIVLRTPEPLDYIPVQFEYDITDRGVKYRLTDSISSMSLIRLSLVMEALIRKALCLKWRELDLLIFHSSCLIIDGVAVPFMGAGGSGKSTLARLGLSHGLTIVGDDAAALSFTEDGYHLSPLTRLVGFYNHSPGKGAHKDYQESHLFDHKHGFLEPDKYGCANLGRSVFFPKISGEYKTSPPSLIGKSRTFSELARNCITLKQSPPVHRQSLMDRLALLSNRAKGYDTPLGADIIEDTNTFARFVSEISRLVNLSH
jgi:hypothetical protein